LRQRENSPLFDTECSSSRIATLGPPAFGVPSTRSMPELIDDVVTAFNAAAATDGA
jgi:hypothetical protein